MVVVDDDDDDDDDDDFDDTGEVATIWSENVAM